MKHIVQTDGGQRGEEPEKDEPQRPDAIGKRGPECGKPDHVDGQMPYAAVQKRVAPRADESIDVERVAAGVSQRDERQVQDDPEFLHVAQHIGAHEVGDYADRDERDDDTGQVEDRFSAGTFASGLKVAIFGL